jgi:hypothetical protein
MNCPSQIADILVQLIELGILRIRAAAWAGKTDQVAIEADHIHNLPAILKNYSSDALKFYWDIERRDFISRMPDHGGFQELWKRLESLTASISQSVLVP